MVDRIARWVITLGGVVVIGSVVAIIVLIAGVTLPLFRPARARLVADLPLPAGLAWREVVSLGVERIAGEQTSLTGYVLLRDGTAVFLDFAQMEADRCVLGQDRLRPPSGDDQQRIAFVERHGDGCYSVFWSDGSASLVKVSAVPQFDEAGRRQIQHRVQTLCGLPAEPGRRPVRGLLRRMDDGMPLAVALFADNRLELLRQRKEVNLFGEESVRSKRNVLDTAGLKPLTALTMDQHGTTLYAGTQDGRLVRWSLDNDGAATAREVVRISGESPPCITALAMVLGDVSLAVGDEAGGLSTWFPVRSDSGPKLRKIHGLQSREAAVRQIVPSRRKKVLLSLDASGTAQLDYPTSQRHLLALRSPDASPLRTVALCPRGSAVVGLTGQGRLAVWEIENPHPEISLKTLFGRVFYEGYDQPVYAWQTTGGEDFEPKFSVVPLLFGTIKGTAYAMLFAAPLALFGAAYTSTFTTPAVKRIVKPAMEITAAVPSVVIGFLAALWLAPLVTWWIVAVFALLMILPATLLVFLVLWQPLRRLGWAKRVENGWEFAVLIPVLAVAVGLAGWAAGPIERALFGGNFTLWLYETVGARYDQRNCIIIAFGLGFAVIPIIFSVAEDALSAVPQTLSAASMALGASRWQTLWRVVLPSASPGIFAGMMIGFGRAVGETMIVLMATGNTPIMDFSPFNGMRTLSANIAVEMPEAPEYGTLYRVLYLCGVLLFSLTFVLNTAAELVRQRLRKRYGRL